MFVQGSLILISCHYYNFYFHSPIVYPVCNNKLSYLQPQRFPRAKRVCFPALFIAGLRLAVMQSSQGLMSEINHCLFLCVQTPFTPQSLAHSLTPTENVSYEGREEHSHFCCGVHALLSHLL